MDRYTALATSTDGENWVKPNLGLANFNNSRANNLIWPLDWRDNTHAAGTVFYDENPAAPPDAKWKMVAQWTGKSGKAGVYVLKSADGLAFSPMYDSPSLSWSDTKNVMWWDAELGKYVVYIRIGRHKQLQLLFFVLRQNHTFTPQQTRPTRTLLTTNLLFAQIARPSPAYTRTTRAPCGPGRAAASGAASLPPISCMTGAWPAAAQWALVRPRMC